MALDKGMKEKDDWNWVTYTGDSYLRQVVEVLRDKSFDFFVNPDDLIKGDDLSFRAGCNIHNNSRELYALLYLLQPQSILEVGCGMCYQLANLPLIVPKAELYGIDISQSQIDIGKWYMSLPDNIYQNVKVMDITKEIPDRTFDFVFSQAVVMHLSTENAINALANMKKASNEYVFLIENPGCHENWEEMVKEVFAGWKLSHPQWYILDGILLTKDE